MSGSDGLLSFLGRISNITLFLMSSIFLWKESSPYLGNITCLPKGDKPIQFLLKKRRHLITLLNVLYKITSGCLSYSTCFKIFDMKDSVWSLHRRNDYISLCYRSLTGTRNTHISDFLVVIYFVKALDSIILEIYL